MINILITNKLDLSRDLKNLLDCSDSSLIQFGDNISNYLMMKKLIILLLVFIPAGIFAQDSQGIYTLKNDNSNNLYADIGNAFLEDSKVVFTPQDRRLAYNRDENSSKTFLDLPNEEFAKDDWLIKNKYLLEDIDFNKEGVVSFTKDKKTVFFSVNRKIKNGKQKNEKIKRSVNLQLFKASVNENGEWENLEMLPFNSNRFSTGQPALNQDDTKLYFVSDGPESLGRTDIFVVDLFEDGTYGKPVNLGPKINTRGREIFPLTDKGNILYYSSDVNNGSGELDVFACKIFDNTISTPIKLKATVNGGKDNFTYRMNDKKYKEYFSTIRQVDDSINLKASLPVDFMCQQEISGIVKNVNTNELLPDVQIMLFDNNNKKLQSFISSKTDASFSFKQACNTTFKLKGYLDGYLIGEIDIKTINDLYADPLEIVMNMSIDPSREIGLMVDLPPEVKDIEDAQNVINSAEIAQSSELIEDSVMSSPYNFNSDYQVYTVQIGAFLRNAQTDRYVNLASLFNHLYDDGFNRYYSGVFETYVEAVNYLKLMKKNGYNDAFVVGLKGDRRF